jgi:NAD(P)-dependent dehydrogenase (short-subunit alcohol dehydrogenase family)
MGPGSSVVLVSSIAALSGNGSSLPYVVSKAALNALTLGLARALAPDVRVNAVLPGLIEGRWMRDGLGDAVYERVKGQFADTALLGRVATPDDIASAIGWLLDARCLMTGQLMVVDGGFSLGKPPAVAGTR